MEPIAIKVASNHSGETRITYQRAMQVISDDMMNGDGSLMVEIKDRIHNSMPHQKRAIQETNEYMAKYCGEEPREGHITPAQKGTSELEICTASPNHNTGLGTP